jgi:ADP-ribose pyrophosphatase YjhB (NUDIX family)
VNRSYQPDNTRVPCGCCVVVPRFPVDFMNTEEKLPEDVPLLVLLRKGSHGPGTVCLPGGWVSISDGGLTDTASRELWEEVGLTSTSFLQLGVTMDHHPDRDPGVTIWFLSLDNNGDGAKNTNPDRAEAVYWLSKYELRRMNPQDVFTPLKNALERNII